MPMVKVETNGEGLAENNGLLPLAARIANVAFLRSLVVPVPPSWLGNAVVVTQATTELHSFSCNNYDTVILAWRKALRWRREIGDMLVTMLAVGISTEQVGDQLFLQTVAQAGSAKTRLCEAMLVSKTCYPLDHLTGFHSGYSDGSGKDFSLIARANRKTWITAEGNTLTDSPNFQQLMSQTRRIFDGTSGAIFKNRDEDLRHTGLRSPWIMAGTPAIMNHDQSSLGDRFIKIWMDPPDDDEKQAILRRVAFSAMRAVVQKSSEDATTQLTAEMADAYCLTAGYLEWLKNNVCELLSSLIFDEDKLAHDCAARGEFTAAVRARPVDKRESHDEKELPTRLTHQFARLAMCVAAVFGKKTIDDEVMRLVTKVSLDTCRGVTYRIVTELYKHRELGMTADPLYLYVNCNLSEVKHLLRFMKQVEVVEYFHTVSSSGVVSKAARWRLTPRMLQLYEEVHDVKIEIPDDET